MGHVFFSCHHSRMSLCLGSVADAPWFSEALFFKLTLCHFVANSSTAIASPAKHSLLSSCIVVVLSRHDDIVVKKVEADPDSQVGYLVFKLLHVIFTPVFRVHRNLRFAFPFLFLGCPVSLAQLSVVLRFHFFLTKKRFSSESPSLSRIARGTCFSNTSASCSSLGILGTDTDCANIVCTCG